MRWPLRNQILLPMVSVILALLGVSLFNAYLSVSYTRARIEREVRQVADTLVDSSFPLNHAVLRKMRGLSGADFVLTRPNGEVIASSTDDDAFSDLPLATSSQFETSSQLALARPIVLESGQFYHAMLQRQSVRRPGERVFLHILYAVESYRQAWRKAAYPPLLVGAGAILLVTVLSLGVASRVTRPLRELQELVNSIAEGDFRSMEVPRRDDEVAELTRSVNRMALMLAQYESEVRRNERLRTLGQLGGGIAHELRNSATGCRMALDLYARECGRASESLDVAKRQLELMEKSLQRFLSIGRSRAAQFRTLDVAAIVRNVISLVRPTAQHVGVQLEWKLPEQAVCVDGDETALEQLIINLALNGIEAASAARNASANSVAPMVGIGLEQTDRCAVVEVVDSGDGPAKEVQDRIFDPFVTAKADGTGLGLSVAKETARAHQGDINWSRQGGSTRFAVALPLAEPNMSGE